MPKTAVSNAISPVAPPGVSPEARSLSDPKSVRKSASRLLPFRVRNGFETLYAKNNARSVINTRNRILWRPRARAIMIFVNETKNRTAPPMMKRVIRSVLTCLIGQQVLPGECLHKRLARSFER